MKINISIKQTNILKFNNLQTDTVLNATASPGIGLEHDLEMMGPDKWLVHIDTRFTQPGMASVLTRTSFKINTAFENIWAEPVAIEYVKNALAVCRECFNQECKVQDIDCFIEDGFAGANTTMCLQELLKDVHANELYSNEDKSGYNWNTLKIPPGGYNGMVAFVTTKVLDEIFFNNPAFNRKKNIEIFNGFIPLRFYSTIKFKLIKLLDKKTIHLSLKQLTLYIFMIRCTCTLLLSQHYDSMKESLEKNGITEVLFNQYIKAASSFLNDIKTNFEKMDFTIMNLEEDIDWAGLVC